METPNKWSDHTWVALCDRHFHRDYRAGLEGYCDAEEQTLLCDVTGCNEWATIELDVGLVPIVEEAIKDLESDGPKPPFEQL